MSDRQKPLRAAFEPPRELPSWALDWGQRQNLSLGRCRARSRETGALGPAHSKGRFVPKAIGLRTRWDRSTVGRGD